jgi:predicted RNase H-like HicB family nuclease
MNGTRRLSLSEYLRLDYPFNVIADPDGGYVIEYPDLPGCLTQADTMDEIGPMAEEARSLWIESVYERGLPVPLPSYPEEYSGKFVVRLPKRLHRRLAEAAEREGVSLNQYIVGLLSQGLISASVGQRLDQLEAVMQARFDQLEARLNELRDNVYDTHLPKQRWGQPEEEWDTVNERGHLKVVAA